MDDIIVRDETGKDIYYGGMALISRSLYRNIESPLLAKTFGGFTSEVVAEMCANWFGHNPYFEDFCHFDKI